jgi:single-stranded DNA-binding protein
MAIEGRITGNLLSNPIRKTVNTAGGEKHITEFRMMSDVWKNVGDNVDPIQDEDKTKPVQVTVWNERLAEVCALVYRKGMRLQVYGDIYMRENKASEAERAEGKRDFADLRCDAQTVALLPNRVEQIVMREKAQEQAAG